MLAQVLSAFDLNIESYDIEKFGSGLINHTWKISNGQKEYILQRVNNHVFKEPEKIAENILMLQRYLQQYYPEYLFVAPLLSNDEKSLVHFSQHGYFRLFPFIANSHTVNTIKAPEEAYEAASQFGKFTRLLSAFNIDNLHYTLPDFHNLLLRYQQFEKALPVADFTRLKKSDEAISFIKSQHEIVAVYNSIINNKKFPLRVIHHDTKISNVLFDSQNKGLCVIDLDTVMPGFYLSDIGDMMRTYLSPAGEEETDFNKIEIREDFFHAIYDGYFSEMKTELTALEKNHFLFAGKFIIYMQAIRFLTDYLQNDRYYGAAYEEHNLARALNQITLLQQYLKAEPALSEIISS